MKNIYDSALNELRDQLPYDPSGTYIVVIFRKPDLVCDWIYANRRIMRSSILIEHEVQRVSPAARIEAVGYILSKDGKSIGYMHDWDEYKSNSAWQPHLNSIYQLPFQN